MMSDEQDEKTPNPRILIVENQTAAAMMMVNVLSQAGCDVAVANTGKKGMELAQESRFDLIVLSMDLPDTSGFGIASELKQRHLSRHTPIVFVASQLSEEDRRHSLELGAVEYIAKPFESTDFVQRILGHASLKTENNEAIQWQ